MRRSVYLRLESCLKDRLKDFQQLIDFNRAITDERRGYLQEEREEVEVELKRINAELNFLGKKRSEMLSFLSETDILVNTNKSRTRW
jgi:uncharacterized protein YydD (DUF2326 family)